MDLACHTFMYVHCLIGLCEPAVESYKMQLLQLLSQVTALDTNEVIQDLTKRLLQVLMVCPSILVRVPLSCRATGVVVVRCCTAPASAMSQ